MFFSSAHGGFHRRLCAARKALGTLAFLACCLVAVSAGASDKDDHERARRAVQAGQVLPLPAILERLSREHAGQVMKVELEQEDDLWIYEIKLLKADGKLIKIKLDARTAADLRSKTDNRGRSERAKTR